MLIKKISKKKLVIVKKNLVIVEFFVKVKIIEKYLGCNYKVVVLVGYICDLKKLSMFIDFENNYEL